MSLNTAQPRDIQSLQNWLGGNGCLAEEECAYLALCGDLACLAPAGDNAMLQLEAWVEDRLVRFWQNFRKVIHKHYYQAVSIRISTKKPQYRDVITQFRTIRMSTSIRAR